MDHLEVRLFGGLEIHSGDLVLPALPTKKSEKLFAYLVLNRGRPVHRDVLCGEFWGDLPQSDARKALRTALWRIRTVLEPTSLQRGDLVRVEGDLVGLTDQGEIWVDTATFEAEVVMPPLNGHSLPADRDVQRVESAIALYRGDFLEGHYDEWSLHHRERLRMLRLTALERLVTAHHDAGRWLDAITWGRQLLREDPLREHIHRTVMAAHFAMGNRPSALRQYQDCVRLLDRELAIEPMSETRDLYDSIRQDESAAVIDPVALAASATPNTDARVEDLAAEVESALKDLYALAERLEKTRQALSATGRI